MKKLEEQKMLARGQVPTEHEDRFARLATLVEEMHKAHSAPVEIVRDPKTGKALGARRVTN
jgi:hypothetical protein